MSPAKDRFIELATQPLSDNAELKLAAEGELRRRLNENDSVAIGVAIRSLESADRHSNRKWWFRSLLIVTAIVSVLAMAQTILQVRKIVLFRTVSPLGSESSILRPALADGITPQQELLLFGAEGTTSRDDRWKPLWESDPDNPAYFAQYVTTSIQKQKEASPDLLAEANRIDPENGWFLALEAACVTDRVVSIGQFMTQEEPAKWIVRDPRRFSEALDILHLAASKPRIKSYQDSLMSERMSLLKPRTDFDRQQRRHTLEIAYETPFLHMRNLSRLLSAGAQECAIRGDVDGFRRIIADWEMLSRSLAMSGTCMQDLLYTKEVYNSPSWTFCDAANKLGLYAEAERFWMITNATAPEYCGFRDPAGWKNPGYPAGVARSLFPHSSILAANTLSSIVNEVQSRVPITEADLKPGRLADHAMFERACSIAGLILLGTASGLAAFHRFRHGQVCHRLATRLSRLASTADWMWMFAGGIIVPLLCYIIVTRFTPLSFRDWSLRWTVFLVPSAQFGAMVASMLVLPVIIARWRLNRRGAFLGLKSKRMSVGTTAGILSLLAIPAAGIPNFWGSEIVMIPVLMLIAFPLIWLITGLLSAALGNRENAIRRELLAILIVPSWIAGACTMAIASPIFYQSERYWIQRDQLLEISAETHGVSRYEWLVTQQLRKELLEMMDQPR